MMHPILNFFKRGSAFISRFSFMLKHVMHKANSIIKQQDLAPKIKKHINQSSKVFVFQKNKLLSCTLMFIHFRERYSGFLFIKFLLCNNFTDIYIDR